MKFTKQKSALLVTIDFTANYINRFLIGYVKLFIIFIYSQSSWFGEAISYDNITSSSIFIVSYYSWILSSLDAVQIPNNI